jgi:hypothetical protein
VGEKRMSENGYTHHRHRGVFSDSGWLQSVIWNEVLVPEEQSAPESTLPPALGAALARHPVFPVVRRADGALAVPSDDRVLWRLARHAALDGHEAAGYCRSADELRALVPQDIDESVSVPDPSPRADSGFAHEFADVPGLKIVPMTWRHLEEAAARAVESGIYPAVCPTYPPCCNPPEAHAWMQLAARLDTGANWQLALEFEGRPLQLELITFEPQSVPVVRFTAHLTRERPHWFWREAEAPVFANLRARGFRYAHSLTRSDRPDWIQALKDNYQANEVATYERSVALEFATDAPVFSGFPERKRLGWQFQRGALTVREATEDELPDVAAAITQEWASASREALAQRVLREWWHLDRATVLVGIVNGQMTFVRTVRQRRGSMSALAHLTPLDSGPAGMRPLMAYAVNDWQQQAGYARSSTFIPSRLWAHSLVRDAYRTTTADVRTRDRSGFAETFVEVDWDISATREKLRGAAE